LDGDRPELFIGDGSRRQGLNSTFFLYKLSVCQALDAVLETVKVCGAEGTKMREVGVVWRACVPGLGGMSLVCGRHLQQPIE
jgi:hypothetical protein